jgi:hypothetical protein
MTPSLPDPGDQATFSVVNFGISIHLSEKAIIIPLPSPRSFLPYMRIRKFATDR